MSGRAGSVRPRDEEGGVAIAVDLDCLTAEQRQLWNERLPELKQWTDGSMCQATLLELRSFGHICMLETDAPNWRP
jgi:hypothetical protein